MKIVYAFMFNGPKRVGIKFDSIGYKLNRMHYLGHFWGSARGHLIKMTGTGNLRT